jgi:hypothetical protein
MWTQAKRGRLADIEKKTKRYPTDLTDEEWDRVTPFLPRPATVPSRAYRRVGAVRACRASGGRSRGSADKGSAVELAAGRWGSELKALFSGKPRRLKAIARLLTKALAVLFPQRAIRLARRWRRLRQHDLPLRVHRPLFAAQQSRRYPSNPSAQTSKFPRSSQIHALTGDRAQQPRTPSSAIPPAHFV